MTYHKFILTSIAAILISFSASFMTASSVSAGNLNINLNLGNNVGGQKYRSNRYVEKCRIIRVKKWSRKRGRYVLRNKRKCGYVPVRNHFFTPGYVIGDLILKEIFGHKTKKTRHKYKKRRYNRKHTRRTKRNDR